jgi:ribonuclease D
VLDPHTGAVLRALWQWREAEAEMADRPAFHILQNHELLRAAERFISGHVPDYKHFSARRRQTFHEAAKIGLQSSQSEWPVMRRRSGCRPTPEMRRHADQLRERRDNAAVQLGLEPSFIASRGALDAIAVDPARATSSLVPWQRELIGID